ncbi:Dual specificity protein phosphatase 14 [Armadillidium nasatum]|uniref:Dual specificity protein phosphatase 14 n=1 Tax=Armadillidium nasatum TaxID=96803 RepID=A0A5N5TH28_9CRUS|nr:Dual specificity protein phosphatase 14 [Armadillidium nasatum]
MVKTSEQIKSLKWMGEISEVTPWLLLSGARVVRPSRLKECGVTTVINVTTELPQIYIDGIQVLTIRINDSQSENIKHIFHEISDKLLKLKLKRETVLVHCVAGVSRSPTIILSYLVKHEGFSLQEAFFRLKKIRPIVRPNTNFFRQLIEFEKEVRGTSSVKVIRIPDSNINIPDVFEEEIRKIVRCRSWTDMIKERSNISNQFS